MHPCDHVERQAIIEHGQGPLLILAGHGTGKTTLLLERTVHLCHSGLAWHPEIILLTFTRRAGAELRQRLQQMFEGEDASNCTVSTLHALARRVLLIEPARRARPFRLFLPNEAFHVLRQAIVDTKLPETAWPPVFVAGLISTAKEHGVTPEQFTVTPTSPGRQAVAQTYAAYQQLLAQANGLDFGDLIFQATALLHAQPELLAVLRGRYRFLLVDEFQDLSPGQYSLLRLLAGPGGNLTVAASPAQAIYGWRRASFASLARAFTQDYPDAHTIHLSANFRSTAHIIRAAGSLFSTGQYPDVELQATRCEGEQLRLVRLPDERAEAAFVAAEAGRLLAANTAPNEIAVLYRNHAQSARLEEAFRKQAVPYCLPGRERLLHREVVRHLLGYLALVAADDEAALEIVINAPPRGFGPAALGVLRGDAPSLTWTGLVAALGQGPDEHLNSAQYQSTQAFFDLITGLQRTTKGLSTAALIDTLVEQTSYRAWLLDELDGEARLESLRELRRLALAQPRPADFLKAVRAEIEADLERPGSEAVALLSIHAAKGQQFRVVFVVGLDEGVLPSAAALEGGDEAGERRLAHVAFSRACDLLYLVHAESRERDGRRSFPRPSRYLAALPRELWVRYTPPAD